MKKSLARTYVAFTALVGLVLTAAAPAQAALQVDITDSSQSAIPIAIAPFGSDGGQLPVDVAQVASDDLESTGLFDVFERRNMVAKPTRADQVNYDNWRTSSVDNLVVGSAAPNGQGGYRITFDLLDVYQGRSIASFQINAGRNELRDAAHTVANLIYEKFVGEKGYFLSRIAYITMAKENGGLRYRLIVSDYDGNNPATVYSSRDPIMSPSWSPDGSKIAYVAFDINRGRSSLRVQDLATGNIREISSREGINGAPSWAPVSARRATHLVLDGHVFEHRLDHDLTGLEPAVVGSPGHPGQVLVARRMGKTRIIAETGAGQHGVATATACARFGLPCTVFMGATDVVRQKPNVFRMKLLGAEIVPVSSGTGTLKDAMNEALRAAVVPA